MQQHKKKILYITPGLPIGGAEKFLVSLSTHFENSGSANQKVVTLSNHNPIAPEFHPAVDIRIISRRSRFDHRALLSLRKYFQDLQPDIVFCINFFSYIFFRLATTGLNTNSRIFISYHSTIHVNRKDHLLHKLFFTFLRQSDKIITVCNNQAEYTIKTYGVPREAFQTIYNGIDTNHWIPALPGTDRKALRSELGLPVSGPLIVKTAGFRPEKNHLGAIRALNILHREYHIPASLVFVGDGAMRPKIEEAVKASGLEEYIILKGQQSDVRPFYHASDLFTLTSESVETFSIAALEAMSCGLPAVLTDIGGAREMVKDGLNGFICDTSPEDIAGKWAKALVAGLSGHDISLYIREHFDLKQMTTAYEQIMGISLSAFPE